MGAMAAEKFRAILTPEQVTIWDNELTGHTPARCR